MSKITFDDGRRPIIVLVWPREYSLADVEEFVVELKALITQKRRIAVINDILRTRPPTASERKLISDAIGEVSNDIRGYVAGWSDVTSNPLIRGALVAIRWVNPSVGTHAVHANLAEAEQWCRAQLEKQALQPAGN